MRTRVLAACLALLFTIPAWAQPSTFGSDDDPAEDLQPVWWRRDSSLDVMGGLSLIGPQWRTAGTIGLNLVQRRYRARFEGTLRAGIYGTYEPDVDDLYDALRLLDFVRLDPGPGSGTYLRVGVVDRMRLGIGHLVDFYDAGVSWDERTVGAEFQQRSDRADLSLFAGDLLMNSVVGGRLAIRPRGYEGKPLSQPFTIAVQGVADVGTFRADSLHRRLWGVGGELFYPLLSRGGIDLVPWGSGAWYPDYGLGLGFGADVVSDNFIDVARFRARAGLLFSGKQFSPGFVGSFYPVHNPLARILDTEGGPGENAGVRLQNMQGGTDLLTELRILVFRRLEFWYQFRRHYGKQSTSDLHLRFFLRTPRFVAQIGQDRGGLAGFFSIFNDLGDQTSLIFQTDYNPFGSG